MEKTSQQGLRPLIACSELGLPEMMVNVARALSGSGPALGFGMIRSTHVPEEIAFVTTTTGSSGIPKEVGLTTSALLSSARASHTYLGADSGQIWSLLLPPTHIAALNVLVRSVELGTSPIDFRITKRVKKFEVADFTAIVPTQLFRALDGDAELLDHLKNCQAVLVGGAALSESMAHDAENAGITVVQTSGMSETSGGCIYNGEPLSGVEVKIINGQVAIKGATLASTYINDRTAWLEKFDGGWFLTSDQGTLTDGKLKILGRDDDVIISGGENISLNAIEESLSSHFSGIAISAFALPDKEWGSSLHIAIAGNSSIPDGAITLFLTQTYGEMAKPKGFHRLIALPLIGIGKVDRNALMRIAAESTAEEVN